MTRFILTILLLGIGTVLSAQTHVENKDIEEIIQLLKSEQTLKKTDRLKSQPSKISLDKVIEGLYENRARRKKDSVFLDEFKKDLPTIISNYASLENYKFDNKKLGLKSVGKRNTYRALSLPYFNLSKDVVLVIVSMVCPGMCGSEQIIMFEKKDGIWKVRIRSAFMV